MNPVSIARRTRAIGAPQGWDEKLDGPCGVLTVRDEVDVQSGINFMRSLWQPTDEDLRLLNLGLPIMLRISGTAHPVVSMGMAEPADVA